VVCGDNHPGHRNRTFPFFKETNVDVANALANKPQMYIAEMGWSAFSSTTVEKTDGASEASEPNQQIFRDISAQIRK
jgi:hypothetical protein